MKISNLDGSNMWFVSKDGNSVVIDNITNPEINKQRTDREAFNLDLDTAIGCLDVVIKNAPKDYNRGEIISRVGKLISSI